MFSSSRHIKNLTRICLILVYVSFFSVQFNLHFGKTPEVSYFTGDFISQQSDNNFHSVLNKGNHKDSGHKGFRLNKRFHPSYLFTAPDVLQDLVNYSFSIETILLNETQPLTNFSFNFPSLRGPPSVV
jgi:hypothetical protein